MEYIAYSLSIDLSIYQWKFRLLPCLGNCKQNCSDYLGECILWTTFSSGYITRSEIAGSYGSSIFFFKFYLGNLHSIPYSDHSSDHSHHQCRRVPLPPHLSSIHCRYFDNGHPDWCEVMIPHCIFDLHFSNISDVEHLFLCLLGTCTSSLEESLFRFSDKFLIELFVCFWYWAT